MAAGQADRRSDQPLSGDEASLIGDVAHMISATVALQLVEEGRLELDQPIAQITPELAARFEHGDDVTVRHLLGHTSGLADYATSQFASDFTGHVSIEDCVVEASCPRDGPSLDPLDSAAGRDPRFEPGARGEPSITDMLLPHHVIEAVTDTPPATVYRERVFDPLGTDHTWMVCADRPRAELARGYREGDPIPFVTPGVLDDEFLDVTDFDGYLGAPAPNRATAPWCATTRGLTPCW